jgi:hypothetical protein
MLLAQSDTVFILDQIAPECFWKFTNENINDIKFFASQPGQYEGRYEWDKITDN